MSIGYAELRYGFIGALGVSIFIVTYLLAGSPSRPASRLGLRGLKRTRSLEEGGTWPSVEPLVRWLGVRLSPLVDDAFHARMDRQLALAGDPLGITPTEYVALSLLSFLGGIVLGYFFGVILEIGPVLLFIVAPVAAALPYLQISAIAEERLKGINRGLPYAIDLLALAMSAGQDFPGAVRQLVSKAGDTTDPIVEEFSLILQELQVGRTRREALLSFSARIPLDAVNEFVSAVVQAEERGNPVAGVLQIQANVSRMRRTVRAEENASKAAVKMIGPLMLVFVCIILLVLAPMILKIQEQMK